MDESARWIEQRSYDLLDFVPQPNLPLHAFCRPAACTRNPKKR
jgi:hypothetical protein